MIEAAQLPRTHEPAGLFAACWALLARLAALLATAESGRAAEALFGQLERLVLRAVVAGARKHNPALDIDPASLRIVWRDGRMEIVDASPAASGLSRREFFRGKAWRTELAERLRGLRALRRLPVLHALRGANRFNRRAQIVILCEQRRHHRRRRTSTFKRARSPARVHPLALVPP
jgi:hypothetical protein